MSALSKNTPHVKAPLIFQDIPGSSGTSFVRGGGGGGGGGGLKTRYGQNQVSLFIICHKGVCG